MEKQINILLKSKLFCGLSDTEILSALNCLNAKIKVYHKNAVIFFDGGEAVFTGIILSGEIQTQKTDYNGNTNIISKLYSSDCIAASAGLSTEKKLPFDVVCAAECEVLALDTSRLIQSCKSACSFHTRLIKNLLNIIADMNIVLANKIDILTKRTIREKLLAYLYSQSKRAKNQSFSVPLSRRQMAEYLSINRSALSRELCVLRDEGLLDFKGNSFILK